MLTGPTRQFLQRMEQIRSLPEAQRNEIAVLTEAEIRAHLATRVPEELRELRRRAQERRAQLIYEGARDITDARFAAVMLTEQWAIAAIELLVSRSALTHVLAERRRNAIEQFVRDHLPDEIC